VLSLLALTPDRQRLGSPSLPRADEICCCIKGLAMEMLLAPLNSAADGMLMPPFVLCGELPLVASASLLGAAAGALLEGTAASLLADRCSGSVGRREFGLLMLPSALLPLPVLLLWEGSRARA
jgi:hypothetical protein